MLYSSLLFTVRFLQGISWGYSPLFMHQNLDKEIVLSIKVVVNLSLMVWQNFRENQQLSQALNERDIVSLYFPRETFISMQG